MNRIQEFEEILKAVRDFNASINELGEPLQTMATVVQDAFEAEFQIIKDSETRPAPRNKVELNEVMKPVLTSIAKIQKTHEQNRGHKHFNTICCVSESITGLLWIGSDALPGPFIKDMTEAGRYYGNRVLTEYKGNAAWPKQWYNVMQLLQNFVRTFYTTGFTWGGSQQCQGPPPPPPPPPAAVISSETNTSDSERAALLRDLNQGTDITKRLKNVSAHGPVTSKKFVQKHPCDQTNDSSAKSAIAKPAAMPVFSLDGKKWRIEHQVDSHDIVVDQAQMSECVALFKCKNATVQVMNKVNYITIDSCKKTAIVVEDIISAIEIIHCEDIKVQCKGNIPLVNIDSTDNITVYAGRAKPIQFISSKVSSMNFCAMDESGDYCEFALPEQLKSEFIDGKLKSSVVEKM